MTSVSPNPPPPIRRRLRSAADFAMRHSAIIALALFAVVGFAVLDDYGVTGDAGWQRTNGYVSYDYILAKRDALIGEYDTNRYYGVAFELALTATERGLGLEDSRHVYLVRHLLTHLLFLAGGFFAWLLAYRLFGSRAVALLAMLIFLLHPRLYAHSFFNTKDLPFLSVFMISLCLIHRAFRRDEVWAFALCGVGVAALTNIRLIGVMLFAAVLGMLALDLFHALRSGRGVKRVLANGAAFSLAAGLTLYATFPVLWKDPLALADGLRTLGAYPLHWATLFRGEWVQWPNIPWDFIPTWMLITTPPVALALAALGIASVARLCAADWRGMFANSDARFALLAAACLVLPVAAAIVLNSNLYGDWRHMYFLYAPLCVLAAFGLNALASIPMPRLRVGALALTGAGIAIVVVQMVSIHPYQADYFNPPADPKRWTMDYFHVSARDALETLLETYPNERVDVARSVHVEDNWAFLPSDDRRGLNMVSAFPDFNVVIGDGGENSFWKREVYGVPIISILDERAESEAAYRAAYARARSSAPLASAGGFEIYDGGDRLIYIKESCGEADTLGTFAWRIIPANPEDAAGRDLERRFEFLAYGASFDGNCLMSLPIPGYEIAAIEAAQWADGEEETPLWSVSVPLAKSPAEYAAALSALPDSPDARAEFDIYADSDRLIYVKSPCADGDDAIGQFRLAVFPANIADLPQRARAAGRGRETIHFHFHRYGAAFDGKCVVIHDLPDYRISRVETGRIADRRTPPLWSAEIRFDGYYDRFRRALAALPAEPSARAGFDLYADLDERTLTYVKSPCAEDGVRGRFFLSVFPVDLSDVERENRDNDQSHNSLNFTFNDYGGLFDGKCAAIRELPDYPISRIETGQWTSDEGHLWSARIEVGE